MNVKEKIDECLRDAANGHMSQLQLQVLVGAPGKPPETRLVRMAFLPERFENTYGPQASGPKPKEIT
jgi:hypothetical protein